MEAMEIEQRGGSSRNMKATAWVTGSCVADDRSGKCRSGRCRSRLVARHIVLW